MHLDPISALRSSVRVSLTDGNSYILVPSRLPFGGSPCPNEFCLMSDMITDTINDLLEEDSWNQKEIRSEFTSKVPEAKGLEDNEPFAQAKPLSIKIPLEENGKADVYIDDIITIAVEKGDNIERIRSAPSTVIHAVTINSSSYPLPRDDIIEDEKNIAEGGPEETKICLGWLLNTRKLMISLPLHKAKAWDSQITEAISKKSINLKTLESIIGRLENIAQIFPMLGHFLNNIRFLQSKAIDKKHNIFFSKRAKDDLSLSRSFIERAKKWYKFESVNIQGARSNSHRRCFRAWHGSFCISRACLVF